MLGTVAKLATPVWPQDSVFLDVPVERQLAAPGVRCIRLAVCDNAGNRAAHFIQGDRVHLYFEFQAADDLETPVGGAELRNETGFVIHGKNVFEGGWRAPERVRAGTIARVHQWFDLRVAAGRYAIGLGLADTSRAWLARYRTGQISYQEFISRVTDRCRVAEAAWIEVGPPQDGWLPHHGAADLPGGGGVRLGPVRTVPPPAVSQVPPLLHITHWKAGSQWIYAILRTCAPGKIVAPSPWTALLRYNPIQPGCVYPTLYLTRLELESVPAPPNTKRFVVIRDLRDTLVAAYFSFKFSHPILVSEHVELRALLESMDEEAGMMYLLETSMPACARIQLSWLDSDVPLLRYEDLLQDDVALLTDLLIGRLEMPIEPAVLQQAIEAARFDAVNGGRPRGAEDRMSHLRKGVAGDWRNHFTGKIKKAFKAYYGGLLVATGYEKDLNW